MSHEVGTVERSRITLVAGLVFAVGLIRGRLLHAASRTLPEVTVYKSPT